MTTIISNPSAQSRPSQKRLTAAEQKLLQQIQSHVQPRRGRIRFLSNSVCGLWY
jgi:hypothetical protein